MGDSNAIARIEDNDQDLRTVISKYSIENKNNREPFN